MSRSVPKELIQFIYSGNKFIVAGHKEPDGDCAGSQLVLCGILRQLGKEAIACSAGPFNKTEIKQNSDKFLSDLTEKELSGSKLIIVDCSSIERTGTLEQKLKGLKTAVIDHHAEGSHLTGSAEEPVYIDSDSPSCTLLIYKLMKELNLEPTKEEAQALFFGLCTDTGFFRHLNEKSGAAFEAVAQLVAYGADPKKSYMAINGGKTFNSRIQIGKIISRSESYFDQRLIVCYETFEELQGLSMQDRDSDSLFQLLQSIEGVEAIVIIRQELADNGTVGLRSKDKINVANIAAEFGGGGHKNAAGFSYSGSIEIIKEKLLESFRVIYK